jgi:predicted PurR-regulated permease PerM
MLRAVIILGVLFLIIWALSDIALLIFLAVLIAVMLRGVSEWAAHRTGAPASAMLGLVSISTGILVMGLLYYLGPRLISQSHDLWQELQQQVDHLRAAYSDTAWGKAVFSNISPHAIMQSRIASYVGRIATTTLGGVVSGFVLIVTALYFAIAPDLYIGGTVLLFPVSYRPRARAILREIGATLQRWSLGQLIDMAVVGVLTGVSLALLGVPLALALAVLAGLFTFVPYFGAIAAAVPAMLVALTISWQTSLWVAVVFLLCHGIEGYVVAPLVQRRAADLPPALTILSMTILGTLFGPLGIIVGAPLAAVVLVVVREAYVGALLGDEGPVATTPAGSTHRPDSDDGKPRSL